MSANSDHFVETPCGDTDEIIFHVGTIKTGSTIIQSTLHNHRDELQTIGLYYPHVTKPKLDLPRYANANFLYDERPADGFEQPLVMAGATSVVSEESLFLEIDRLDQVVAYPARKRFVIYLRRPAELIASWIAEMAKPYNAFVADFASGGGPLSIDESLEAVVERYDTAASRFVAFLTAHPDWRLTPRAYDTRTFQSASIIADFVSAVGRDASAIADHPWYAHPPRANLSVSRKVADISALVWEHLGRPNSGDVYNQPLVDRVAGLCLSGDDRSVLETLDDAWISRVTDRFAYFERALMDRAGLTETLFRNPLPDIFGQDRAPYQPVDPDEVRRNTDLALRNATDD